MQPPLLPKRVKATFLVLELVVVVVALLVFGGRKGGSTLFAPASCNTSCCQTAPVGECDLVSAMYGYCCEPLPQHPDIIINDPQGPDPRFAPQGQPLGKNFTFTMPWAESIFAKTFNESYSNPGYLAGQAVKHGKNPDSYYDAAMAFERPVLVYIPAGFQVSNEGARVQFIMDGEAFCGPTYLPTFATALENSIAANELPQIVLVCTASGNALGVEGGDRLRDFEYETMSDRNAKFFVEEVLPAVENHREIQVAYPGFKFSTQRRDRATMGCSSSGAASIIASWFAPQYFYRALGYSATLVQIMSTPCTRDMDALQCESATGNSSTGGYPRGAWEFHSSENLIGSNEQQDLRIYHQAGEHDILGCSYYKAGPNGITNCTEQFSQSGNEGYFNIRLANNRSAARLTAKGYQTRFVYSLNQSHCSVFLDPMNGGTTIFDGMVWAWQDQRIGDTHV